MNCIDEYEAELLAETQKQLAVEKLVWDALPQAEKDKINAARERRAAAMYEAIQNQRDEEEE